MLDESNDPFAVLARGKAAEDEPLTPPAASADAFTRTEAGPSSADEEPAGEVVGELCVRWQASELRVDFSAATTVGAVKARLERRTTVPANRQKLVGWADRHVDDSARVANLRVSGRRLLLVGSPQQLLASAALDLERSKRTARLIHSDFREPTESAASAAAALGDRPRRSAEGAVHANRGAGIWMDPAIWAPDPDEADRRRGAAPRRVLNPRSNRVEPLDLSNALLGAGAAGGAQAMERGAHDEDAPRNIDITGQAWGRCTACERCPGYTRRLEPAENPNDVEALRCSRCGCQSHQHERL